VDLDRQQMLARLLTLLEIRTLAGGNGQVEAVVGGATADLGSEIVDIFGPRDGPTLRQL
jgi:hypothetical protein